MLNGLSSKAVVLKYKQCFTRIKNYTTYILSNYFIRRVVLISRWWLANEYAYRYSHYLESRRSWLLIDNFDAFASDKSNVPKERHTVQFRGPLVVVVVGLGRKFNLLIMDINLSSMG